MKNKQRKEKKKGKKKDTEDRLDVKGEKGKSRERIVDILSKRTAKEIDLLFKCCLLVKHVASPGRKTDRVRRERGWYYLIKLMDRDVDHLFVWKFPSLYPIQNKRYLYSLFLPLPPFSYSTLSPYIHLQSHLCSGLSNNLVNKGIRNMMKFGNLKTVIVLILIQTISINRIIIFVVIKKFLSLLKYERFSLYILFKKKSHLYVSLYISFLSFSSFVSFRNFFFPP